MATLNDEQDALTCAINGMLLLMPKPRRTEYNDLGSKLAAQVLLGDTTRRIVVPSYEEWVGVDLLERDDELPTRRK